MLLARVEKLGSRTGSTAEYLGPLCNGGRLGIPSLQGRREEKGTGSSYGPCGCGGGEREKKERVGILCMRLTVAVRRPSPRESTGYREFGRQAAITKINLEMPVTLVKLGEYGDPRSFPMVEPWPNHRPFTREGLSR